MEGEPEECWFEVVEAHRLDPKREPHSSRRDCMVEKVSESADSRIPVEWQGPFADRVEPMEPGMLGESRLVSIRIEYRNCLRQSSNHIYYKQLESTFSIH